LRRKKAWQVYPEQPELVAAVMARHNLPRLVARILLNRGLAAEDDILAFLDPSLERLNPPFELPDLEVAAARLGRDCITRIETLEYPELGMEAIWRIEVEDFPAFIVIDDKGNDFFKELNLG